MEIEPSFIQDIRQMLRQARQQTYSFGNSAMVEAYWNIGRRIVEEEQKGSHRAEYGEGLTPLLKPVNDRIQRDARPFDPIDLILFFDVLISHNFSLNGTDYN